MRLAKITRGRAVGAVLAAAMVAAGTVGLATTSEAAVATYTVTPKTGPGGTNAGGQPASGAKVVTFTGTGFMTGSTTNVTAVRWVAKGTACSTGATALGTIAVNSATRLTATVAANTLALTATASGGLTTYSKKDYVFCVYNGTTLLGQAGYTVYPVPTIDDPVSPTAGSASGGETITIIGTGFTSASVVKFGTTAGTNVKVAKDGASLTVTAPAHAVGTNIDVSVTTEAGAATVGSAGDEDYDYVNAISVSPKTSTGAANDVLTITGTGFTGSNYDWVNDTANDSAIYLFQGAWAWVDANTDGFPDDAEDRCGTVQVVSDTELTCKLAAGAADGAYTVYVLDDRDSGTASVVSSSSTYTAADF